MLSIQDMEVLESENIANANFTGCQDKYNTGDSIVKEYFRLDTVFNFNRGQDQSSWKDFRFCPYLEKKQRTRDFR